MNSSCENYEYVYYLHRNHILASYLSGVVGTFINVFSIFVNFNSKFGTNHVYAKVILNVQVCWRLSLSM